MAPGKRVQISQGAFDSLVEENIEEFGMDAEEAAKDAVSALSLQGADMRGIDTTAPSLRKQKLPITQMVEAIKSFTAQGQLKETREACKALAEPLMSSLCTSTSSTSSSSTSSNKDDENSSNKMKGDDGGGVISPLCLEAYRAGLVEAALAVYDLLHQQQQQQPTEHGKEYGGQRNELEHCQEEEAKQEQERTEGVGREHSHALPCHKEHSHALPSHKEGGMLQRCKQMWDPETAILCLQLLQCSLTVQGSSDAFWRANGTLMVSSCLKKAADALLIAERGGDCAADVLMSAERRENCAADAVLNAEIGGNCAADGNGEGESEGRVGGGTQERDERGVGGATDCEGELAEAAGTRAQDQTRGAQEDAKRGAQEDAKRGAHEDATECAHEDASVSESSTVVPGKHKHLILTETSASADSSKHSEASTAADTSGYNIHWKLAEASAAVAAAAASGSEPIKEQLMEMDAHKSLLRLLSLVGHAPSSTLDVLGHAPSSTLDVVQDTSSTLDVVVHLCAALQALMTADDYRLAVSKTFNNARAIAAEGALEPLLSTLKHLLPPSSHSSSVTPVTTPSLGHTSSSPEGLQPSELFSFGRTQLKALLALLSVLKSLCANEDICRSASDLGAIDVLLQLLKFCCSQNPKPFGASELATRGCAALSQLAGSDANKEDGVAKGALECLLTVTVTFGDDSAAVRESMGAIASLTLRSPANANRAAKAGALEVAVHILEKGIEAKQRSAAKSASSLAPSSIQQTCSALRNMAVRSSEVRDEMRQLGMVDLLRDVRTKYPQCAETCTAALRDMGEDNYQC